MKPLNNKKNIILTELTPTKGHDVIFQNTYKLLSRYYNVVCFKAYNGESSQDYQILNFGYTHKHRNRLQSVINEVKTTYKNTKQVIDYALTYGIKTIISITHGDIGMFFSSFIMPSEINIYIMQHANVDALYRSKIKRLLFKRYKNKLNHIVLCKFISENFINTFKVPKDRVYIWPHPMNVLKKQDNLKRYDCVGLSSSNDEDIIKQLIEYENSTQLFKKNGIHVILKSLNYSYNNGYLKVIQGYLSKTIYDDYIGKANSIFMPFPLSFNMRMSGSFMEALPNRKVVIGTNIPLIEHANKKYPNIVLKFDIESFITTLISLRKKDNNLDSEFNSFITNHSDDNIANIMRTSIEGEEYLSDFDI